MGLNVQILFADLLGESACSRFMQARRADACIYNAKSGWTMLNSGTNLVVQLVLYVELPLPLSAVMVLSWTSINSRLLVRSSEHEVHVRRSTQRLPVRPSHRGRHRLDSSASPLWHGPACRRILPVSHITIEIQIVTDLKVFWVRSSLVPCFMMLYLRLLRQSYGRKFI